MLQPGRRRWHQAPPQLPVEAHAIPCRLVDSSILSTSLPTLLAYRFIRSTFRPRVYLCPKAAKRVTFLGDGVLATLRRDLTQIRQRAETGGGHPCEPRIRSGSTTRWTSASSVRWEPYYG